MLSVTLMSVIKGKAGKVGSVDTYRSIGLTIVLSKVLEMILLDCLSFIFIFTTDDQFGFKAEHSTDLYIYVLKEMVEFYTKQNSSVLYSWQHYLYPSILVC